MKELNGKKIKFAIEYHLNSYKSKIWVFHSKILLKKKNKQMHKDLNLKYEH